MDSAALLMPRSGMPLSNTRELYTNDDRTPRAIRFGRFPRPRAATLLALLALVVATGGTCSRPA